MTECECGKVGCTFDKRDQGVHIQQGGIRCLLVCNKLFKLSAGLDSNDRSVEPKDQRVFVDTGHV